MEMEIMCVGQTHFACHWSYIKLIKKYYIIFHSGKSRVEIDDPFSNVINFIVQQL